MGHIDNRTGKYLYELLYTKKVKKFIKLLKEETFSNRNMLMIANQFDNERLILELLNKIKVILTKKVDELAGYKLI